MRIGHLRIQPAAKARLLLKQQYRRGLVVVCAVAAVFVAVNTGAQAQVGAGSLDPSFGTSGKVVAGFEGVPASMVIQPDGKIVVAGYRDSKQSQTGTDFTLLRYNPDGSPDSSFGSDGQVFTDFFQRNEGIASIALQTDGKVVAGGTVSDPTGLLFGVVRYNTNGTLDTGFGSSGKATVSFSHPHISLKAIAVQPDGKVVVAGFAGAPYVAALARLNTDGSLDTSFGDGGKVTRPDVGEEYGVYAIVVQANGKIVVSGATFTDLAQDFLLVRYDPNGRLDSSFGTSGWVKTDFGGYGDFPCNKLIALPDHKLLLAGTSQFLSGGDLRFVMARYSSDGVLDATFGTGGKVSTPFQDSSNCLTATSHADGRLLLGGFSSESGIPPDFGLLGYNADGSLDREFGTEGRVITDFFGDWDDIRSLVVQGDGRIVALGSARDTQGKSHFALARYNGATAPFALEVSQSSVSAARGTKVRIPIQINRATGFTGPVTITPPAATAAFKPKPPDPTTTNDPSIVLKLKIKDGAPSGAHRATFTGRSQDGRLSAVVVTINIQ